MREMIASEQPRKPYTKTILTHRRNIRTLTLGASIFPGESGGFTANPIPGGADTGKTKSDIFESDNFESSSFDNDIFD